MTRHRSIWTIGAVGIAAVVGFGVMSSLAQSSAGEQVSAEDQSALVATVDAYHGALHAQDREAALALLAPDVMVLESGYLETAEEYLSHHLAADMEFSASVASEREVREAVVLGDVGWVISSSTSKGEFRGHQVNSAGAEIMVLTSTGGEWKIRAIHWSSRKLSD